MSNVRPVDTEDPVRACNFAAIGYKSYSGTALPRGS